MRRLYQIKAIGVGEIVVATFLENHSRRDGIDVEVFLGNFHRSGVEITVRLIYFRCTVEYIPQNPVLFANVGEEDRIVRLQYVDAVRSGDLLDRRSGQSIHKVNQFVLGPITVVGVVVGTFDTGKTKVIVKRSRPNKCTAHLQQNRRIGIDLEGLCNRSEAGAIDPPDPDVGVEESLGDMSPHRFQFLAVGAPWSVEHYEPLALIPNVQKAVAQLQHSRTVHGGGGGQ